MKLLRILKISCVIAILTITINIFAAADNFVIGVDDLGLDVGVDDVQVEEDLELKEQEDEQNNYEQKDPDLLNKEQLERLNEDLEDLKEQLKEQQIKLK
tara:strand:+ start:60 stop:356 length:297 start_codon:yes stop_codon:yes gene_type:complete